MSEWTKAWNDIIRHVFFQDEELKRLMEIPEGTTIIQFIDNYFIRGGSANKLLTDQKVRIVYGMIDNALYNTPYMGDTVLSFDIYVKNEELHNVSRDRLEMRTVAIAERIKYLLMKDRYTQSLYRFREPHQSDMATTTIGFSRYNISFRFLKVL